MKRTSSSSSSTYKTLTTRTVFGSRRRKVDPKPGSWARLRLKAYLSAHPFHRPLHDRQSDSRTWVQLGPMQAFEHPKQAVLVLRIDSDPLIFDPDPPGVV